MATYEEVIENEHTGETALIKSNDYVTFENKREKKIATWEKQHQRELARQAKESAIEEATKLTEEAQQEVEAYKSILQATLTVDDQIDWDAVKDTKPYKEYTAATQPKKEDFFADVKKASIIDIIPYFKKKRLEQEEQASQEYSKALSAYDEQEKSSKEKYEKEKAVYEQKQSEFNANLEDLKTRYESKEKQGVKEYIDLVLERSQYPESLDIFSEVHVDVNQSLIVADIDLPRINSIPKTKEYKYVHSRKEIDEKSLPKRDIEQLYNDTIYQIALRTIHEIIESDYKEHIQTIVFNGWLEDVNKATGKQERKCLLSVQVPRSDFLEIDLSAIDPKECFLHFKGVTAGNLVKLAPVKPIMKVDTKDNRIISADEIIDNVDENKNLATMDWQEFEVLVRDIISKEFAHEGCKVEVTQASRDQGVDAIAFDEDPIRGGKYVIQAKRYNNLVGVSAVRDLYGTVVNEGAVKGILITTSYYGKESLEFAKDKPLKLINGEELLYMFNKHGYNFSIELQDKKRAVSQTTY